MRPTHSDTPWPAALIILAGLVAACGGESGPTPPVLALAKANPSGDNQTAAAGAALALPIRVVVTRAGQPELNATVNWTTSGAGASLTPASSQTDAQGIASSAWTLRQASGATTAAAAVAGASGSPVTFNATAIPGPAASLALAGGGNQSAEVGNQLDNPFQVKAADQFGNGVAGIAVAWAATGGGGAMVPTSSNTNAAGVAESRLTLGPTVGPQAATATVAGLTGSPVAFTATATAPPSPNAVSVANNFFTPTPRTVAVGATVTWTWVNTGAVPHNVESTGSPSFPSSATLTGSGQTYSNQFNTAGTYTYECIVHGAAMSGTIVVQ